MALNFPNPALQTPLNEFSPDSTPAKSTNGVTYIWTNNEKWVASYVVFNDIYVNVTGDNMTGDLTLGTDKITLNAADGSAEFAGDIQSTSQNGGQLAGFRNQIINGSGGIAQRGTTVTAVSDGMYTVDRWNVGGAVVVSSITGLGALCPGIDNGISITTTAGRNWIRQGVELGTKGFAGKFTGEWTLSVWATQAPSCALSFSNDASFGDPVQVVANTAMTPTGEPNRVNGSRTYTHYSHTFDISQTPNAANECLAVQLSFPLSSQTLFTGVQLEPGPVATPFEHRPIATELALCQRYYYAIETGILYTYETGAGQYGRANFIADYPVTMRATPTLALTGAGYWLPMASTATPTGDRSGGLTSIEGTSGSTRNGITRLQVPRLLSSGNEIERGVHYRASGGVCVTADAEL